MDLTLAELAAQGIIAGETAQFFGPDMRLYRHQREALDIGLRDESYIVTTGTGSGKSLTYLLPIIDSIIRNNPAEATVRALLVYPMNALINSQIKALESFSTNWPDSPIRFARYTGQTSTDERNAIQNHPPHILLTNYFMAEYMLLRPSERSMLQTATGCQMRTLVMDELHFYRGRQGADVAMLTRRLQQAAEKDLQIVATSATLATGGSQDVTQQSQKETVAKFASNFFGQDIPQANVVDETLRRVATAPTPQGATELATAVKATLPEPNADSVQNHPLTAWVEEAFGITTQDGRLVRHSPETFARAAERLSQESGLPEELCDTRLREILDVGSLPLAEGGDPVLAFRLHQWLSSGGHVSATLESPKPGSSPWTASTASTTKGCYSPSPSAGNAGRNTTGYPEKRNLKVGWNLDAPTKGRGTRMTNQMRGSSPWTRTTSGATTPTNSRGVVQRKAIRQKGKTRLRQIYATKAPGQSKRRLQRTGIQQEPNPTRRGRKRQRLHPRLVPTPALPVLPSLPRRL